MTKAAKGQAKRPVGAPRKYDRKAVMHRLLGEMAMGSKCLEAIIESSEDYPHVTEIYDWVSQDSAEGRELAYIFNRAQELWCRAQIRKTIEIADDESRDYYTDSKGERKSDNTAVGRDRNRIMARHWAMTKLAPKVFGEKIQTELTGKDGGAIQYEQLVDRPPTETPEQWQERVSKQLQDRQKTLTH